MLHYNTEEKNHSSEDLLLGNIVIDFPQVWGEIPAVLSRNQHFHHPLCKSHYFRILQSHCPACLLFHFKQESLPRLFSDGSSNTLSKLIILQHQKMFTVWGHAVHEIEMHPFVLR